MNDNIDLLVERLHGLVTELMDPAYCGHEPSAVFANKATANQILFAMYGGLRGDQPEAAAVDLARRDKYLPPLYPRRLGVIST